MTIQTDYKQQWQSAEQARWLANEEITELQRELSNTQFALEAVAEQKDELLAALREIAELGEQYAAMVARAAIAKCEVAQ